MNTLTRPAPAHVATGHWLARALGRARLWLRQRRDMARTRHSLMELDDASLRDLALSRSEIDSVAREVHAIRLAERRIAIDARWH
jgi:uncharacterized protein YjiS (DUF1127 family)